MRPSSDSRAQFDIVRRPRNEVSLEDNSTTMMNFEPPQVVAKLMEFIGTREEAVLFVNEEFGRKMGKTLKRGTGEKGGKLFTFVCSGCTNFKIEFRFTGKNGFPQG